MAPLETSLEEKEELQLEPSHGSLSMSVQRAQGLRKMQYQVRLASGREQSTGQLPTLAETEED